MPRVLAREQQILESLLRRLWAEAAQRPFRTGGQHPPTRLALVGVLANSQAQQCRFRTRNEQRLLSAWCALKGSSMSNRPACER